MVLLKTVVLFLPLAIFINACSWVDSSKVKASASPVIAADTLIAPGKSPEAGKYEAAISSFLDTTFKHGTLNGSILVAKEGKVLYEDYSGFAHYRSQRDEITDSSAFHLASVSKTLTATAILKLWQDAKIKIDTPVAVYLPGFPLPAITIRSLLNHRSGLPNYVHYMERLGWNKKQRVTNQAVFDFIVSRYKDIDIAPVNRRFSYSNTNYALLALVIEKVSGLSYPEYMRKTFFEPLGMTHTYVFSINDSARSMPSYFYNGRQYAFDFLDLVYGDKNIYSTVQDLLKFDQALYDENFLHKDILLQACTPYSFEKPGIHNYGLGWRMLLLKNGKKIIYHNGWWHGNRTAYYRLLDEKVTILALCNNDSKMIYSVKKLADLFGPYMQTGEGEEDGEANGLVSSAPVQKKTVARKRVKVSSKKTATQRTKTIQKKAPAKSTTAKKKK